jgi:hypothetical protein
MIRIHTEPWPVRGYMRNPEAEEARNDAETND